MGSSASGQDDPSRALWLATRASKMEPPFPLGTTCCIPLEKFPRKPYNKFFIDHVCSVKMAEYRPGLFFFEFMDLDLSRSINTQKKNSANIQPSWPHTWSISHISFHVSTGFLDNQATHLVIHTSFTIVLFYAIEINLGWSGKITLCNLCFLFVMFNPIRINLNSERVSSLPQWLKKVRKNAQFPSTATKFQSRSIFKLELTACHSYKC